MSIVDPVRQTDLGGVVRALIDEAWRRARRRRLIFAGVLLLAVIGGIVFASLQGRANSQSDFDSAAVLVGPNAAPVFGVNASEHFLIGRFRCRGKRGTFTLLLGFGSSGSRNWSVASSRGLSEPRTGQYDRLVVRRGPAGHDIAAGGRGNAWTARLRGFVTATETGMKQRVVIRLRGRPKGTFALIPTEPGVLKRDSGTQWNTFLG
jgi:hypothetical protein